MKRYVLSPVIGTGTQGDPYRLKVGQYADIAYASLIPSKADGTPHFAWGLAILNATTMTPTLADVQLAALPDKALDATVGLAEAVALNSGLTKLGVVSFTVTAGDTMRSILVSLCAELGVVWTDDGLVA